MQWLIDIIKDIIGDTIGFRNRGDPSGYDVPPGGWIYGGLWRTYDLSKIVPAGAKAVLCNLLFADNVIGTRWSFRKFGNVNVHSRCQGKSQVANQEQGYNFVCPISDDRKIEYKFDLSPTSTNFVIVGWFLAT